MKSSEIFRKLGFGLAIALLALAIYLPHLFSTFLTPDFSGQVTDAKTGKPLANVPMELRFRCDSFDNMAPSRCAESDQKTVTDQNGRYRFRSRVNRSWHDDWFVEYQLVFNASEAVNLPVNGYYATTTYYAADTQGKKTVSIALVPDRLSEPTDCRGLQTKQAIKDCAFYLSMQKAQARIPPQVPAALETIYRFINYYFQPRLQAEYDAQLGHQCDGFGAVCPWTRALEARDPRLCGEESVHGRDECNLRLAIELNTPGPCAYLPDREFSGRFSADMSLTRAECLMYVSLLNKDFDPCKTLILEGRNNNRKYDWEIDNCVRVFVYAQKDASLCFNMNGHDPYGNADSCIEDAARSMGEGVCRNLQNNDKARCLELAKGISDQ